VVKLDFERKGNITRSTNAWNPT